MSRPPESAERVGIAQFMYFLSKNLSRVEYQKLVQMEYQYLDHVLKKYTGIN